MPDYVSMLAFTQLQNLLLLLRFMQLQCTRKPPACHGDGLPKTDNNANDTSSVASAPWQNLSRNAWITGGWCAKMCMCLAMCRQ